MASGPMNPTEIIQTTDVPQAKMQALVKFTARTLETSLDDAKTILLRVLGNPTNTSFSNVQFGDLFDLTDATMLKARIASGVTFSDRGIGRFAVAMDYFTHEIEPCENEDCGEFPIITEGSVVRILETGSRCPFCEVGLVRTTKQDKPYVMWTTLRTAAPNHTHDRTSLPSRPIPTLNETILEENGESFFSIHRDVILFLIAEKVITDDGEADVAQLLTYLAHGPESSRFGAIDEVITSLDDPKKFGCYDGVDLRALIARTKDWNPSLNTQRTQGSKSPKLIDGIYRIERFIAEGAIGRTYIATDMVIGKKVCLKHCYKLNAARQKNLLDEAGKMWDLRNFGIPVIRRVVKMPDGSYMLVMSYLPGDTIKEWVERLGKIHAESVAWIAERILDTLWYLHDEGIVHADVKPENTIVNEEGHTVGVVDFGLALVKPTANSKSIGYTEYFSPPEQVRGDALLPESDFYALGKTMLYMLNGGHMSAVDQNKIPSGTPDLLGDFIKKLVAKPIDERPEHAERLFKEIGKIRITEFGRRHSGAEPIKAAT